ncbi:NB-ARC domain-containing protein [Hamadaea tsunoensis]|uniref:NB-ARC domain-containing protein n=1 Tax=Hamadaea tsunoensis TaxID=53368 RepID=UPI000415B1A6|nr:NB-ARC domain-containing protein [Hamadaea tsunoensis]
MIRAAARWISTRSVPLVSAGTVLVWSILWLPPILDLVAGWFPARGMGLALDWVRGLGPVGLATATFTWLDGMRRKFLRSRLRAETSVDGSDVERPDELEAVVGALLGTGAAQGATVGLTTGLHGAGGFGKTTLARMVSADPRVRRRFAGDVIWVTLGRDVIGNGALAAKVNEVTLQAGPPDTVAASTDAREAGRQLAYVLENGPPRLIVIDDVWLLRQLEPFLAGGRHCARLVTTRNPDLMVGRGAAVEVDQMTEAQARRLLLSGLGGTIDRPVQDTLLAATGRWPLLLGLVNKILASAERTGVTDLSAYAAQLCGRIETRGPGAIDAVGGGTAADLDVGDPRQRADAVQATVAASTGLLGPDELERLRELAVFAEDESIPVDLIGRLWAATADLAEIDTRTLLRRLAELGLITLNAEQGGRVAQHDVLRDYLRGELAPEVLARLHTRLLEIVAADLPRAEDGGTAWWRLDAQHRYLWDHVVEHLRDADGPAAAERLATDLRWAILRLLRNGPEAPQADLLTAGTERSVRMRRIWTQSAHLLGRTRSFSGLADITVAVLATDPDWAPQATTINIGAPDRPRLRPRDLLPAPAPAVRMVHANFANLVYAVRIAPDGGWLAAAGDWHVRLWDAATGVDRGVLHYPDGRVRSMRIAPDGTWIATGHSDGSARTWDTVKGEPLAVHTRHTGQVVGLAVDPGGTWVATRDDKKRLSIWDPRTGRTMSTFLSVTAMAALPDGRLVTGRSNGDLQIVTAGAVFAQTTLKGHTAEIDVIVVAPDGTWCASIGSDMSVRTWDLATGTQRARIEGWESALAISPDSRTLVTGPSVGGVLRTWDPVTGRQRQTLVGHGGAVYSIVFAPDGSWFASAGDDGAILLWDADTTGAPWAVLRGHTQWVETVTVAPDGTWLASGSIDGSVRVWDVDRAEPAGEPDTYAVATAALTADGSAGLLGRHTTDQVTGYDAATNETTGYALGKPAALALALGGRRVAFTSSAVEGLRLADPAGQAAPVVLDEQATGGRLAFSTDGRYLAYTGTDHRLRVWDCESREVAYTGPEPVGCAGFFPGQARLLLYGTDESVRAVALDGTVTGPYTTPPFPVTTVAVAANGIFAAAGDYGYICLEAADGPDTTGPDAPNRWTNYLEGFEEPIRALAFSPDGTKIFAGGSRGLVAVWAVDGREPLADFRLDAGVLAVAWNEAGIVAATFGGVRRLAFWLPSPATAASHPAGEMPRSTETGDARAAAVA